MDSVLEEVILEIPLEPVVVVDGGGKEGYRCSDFERSTCFDHLGVGRGHIDFHYTISVHADGEETVGV